MLLLKRLDDALADRDCIYGVIKGSAVNNDGNNKIGYTAPSVIGQSTVIRTSLRQAGFDSDSIGLVEAHGTVRCWVILLSYVRLMRCLAQHLFRFVWFQR